MMFSGTLLYFRYIVNIMDTQSVGKFQPAEQARRGDGIKDLRCSQLQKAEILAGTW
jgi:hypothetical protein